MSGTNPGAPPTRRHYAFASAAFGLVALYGSLVPLTFQAVPAREALARFAALPYLNLGIESRADFVANILLFVPLGYFIVASLRTDRHRIPGHLLTGAFVVLVCIVVAVSIELVQIFFPPRTTSLNDILAESAGAATGVALWLVVGPAVTTWLRAFLSRTGRLGFYEGLLSVYCIAFVVSQLLPLDLTINLGQLAEKYRGGRIQIGLFTQSYSGIAAMVWDIGTDLVLNAPIGMAAWLMTGGRRIGRALGVAFVAIGALEAAQILVYSRYATTTDVVIGTLGAGLGIIAIRNLSPEATLVRGRMRLGSGIPGGILFARFALACAATFLVAYQWYPFDFVIDAEGVTAGMHRLVAAPFGGYYFGTEFNAFTQAVRKMLFGGILGFLLKISFPAAPTWLVAGCAVAFLLALEFGQAFLPARVPDLGDVIVGSAGVALACWVRSRS